MFGVNIPATNTSSVIDGWTFLSRPLTVCRVYRLSFALNLKLGLVIALVIWRHCRREPIEICVSTLPIHQETMLEYNPRTTNMIAKPQSQSVLRKLYPGALIND